MLKFLQVKLQQYVNKELPQVQTGFRKGRRTRGQIANIRWIIEKAREFQKNTYFCFIDHTKAFDCMDHNKLWKILKEIGIPDHLTCGSWETCMQVKKQQLELDMEQWIGSELGREYVEAIYCHPAYLTYMQSTSWKNDLLEETQAGIKIARRNISNLRYADDTFFMTMQRRTKEPLHESERGQWKSWIKTQHLEI